MDKNVTGARPQPSGGFELYAWLFMRVSGVGLLFLALGHLVIMHIINNVDVIDFNFVADRYRSFGWRIYDLLLLVLAMLHGINGARVVIDDYLRQGKRVLCLSLLYVVGFSLMILGSLVILTFQPPQKDPDIASIKGSSSDQSESIDLETLWDLSANLPPPRIR